jgi:hypothetical protein
MKIIRTRKTRTDIPATVKHNALALVDTVGAASLSVAGYTANTAQRGYSYVRYAAFKASKLPEAYRANRKARARKALVRRIMKAMLP